jgi:BTB/POZ domain-containing protein KCTD9
MTPRSTAAAIFLSLLCALPVEPRAQDLMQYLDLKSDEFTKADLTRADVEQTIAAAGPGGGADFSGKRLNRLDLTGLDLHGVNLQAARLNGAHLVGANLEGANLDSTWGLDADFTGADLKGASIVSAQLVGAKLDRADLTGARLAGDLSKASHSGARLDNVNIKNGRPLPDSRRHRLILRSAKLDGASLKNAGLIGGVFEFASLRDADVSGAILAGCALAGADFRGANITGTDFNGADLDGTHLEQVSGRDAAVNLDKARNLQQAYVK